MFYHGSKRVDRSSVPQALPIEPLFSMPSSGFTTQPGMDVFNPIFSGITPGGSAPTIARMSWTNKPGKAVVATGKNFTGNTTLKYYGQTTFNNAIPITGATNEYYSGQKIVAKAPSTFSTNSYLYVIPYDTTNGYGTPFWQNKIDAQWLQCSQTGNTSGRIGDTVSVCGFNMSNGGSPEKCWIYLQPAAGNGEWIASTSVCKHRVEFIIPATVNGSATSGDYGVWMHNGHGDKYGFSDLPLTLTVTTDSVLGINWSAHSVNLSSYSNGNPGDPDASIAFNLAIAALSVFTSSPGTIVLQSGTYKIKSAISALGSFGAGIKIIGAGKNSTIIETDAAYSDAGMLTLATNGCLQDLTLRYAAGTMTASNAGLYSGIFIKNCVIDFRNLNPVTGGATFRPTANCVVDGCDIIGGGIYASNANGLIFRNSNFYMCHTTSAACYVGSMQNLIVQGCTFQDLDTNGPDTSRGWGRAVAMFLGGRSIRHVLQIDNTTYSLEAPAAQDQNSGEQFLVESTDTLFNPTAVSGTATSITFLQSVVGAYSGAWATDNRYGIVINSGTGAGQYAYIAGGSSNGTNTTLTLDRTLLVAPDSTSVCFFGTLCTEWILYRNTIDGKNNFNGGSVGWELFMANATHCSANENTVTRTRAAYAEFEFYDGTHSTYASVHMFNEARNNSSSGTELGVRIIQALAGANTEFFGNIHESNNLSGINQGTDKAALVAALSGGLHVFDSCTFSGEHNGILDTSSTLASNLILINNTFTGDGLSGSKAINTTGATIAATLTADPSPASSQFTNFLT